MTDSGDATPADIAAGKIAWVDGVQVTGTMQERFTEVLPGVVEDRQTGFWWLKNAGCWEKRNYGAAVATAAGLVDGQCGLNVGWNPTWRLPTIWELYTLVDPTGPDPRLPVGHPFVNVRQDWYWSSNRMDLKTNVYWTVQMDKVGFPSYDDVAGFFDTTLHYVWPIWD
jgi:hypothetical protein